MRSWSSGKYDSKRKRTCGNKRAKTAMKKWKQVATRVIHQDQWISLRADDCELPSGRIVSPYYVMEEGDWVHIVAIDSQNRILVTTQYRHAGDSVCMEIPCGGVEPGEKPLHAAKREFREETGYEAKKWELVISPFANPARQTNRIHVFLASDLSDTGHRELDENEEIEFEFVSVSGLKKKIFSGAFSQALHIASVFAVLEIKKDPGE
jgi:ADP-ribose pyrophosphatase